MHTHDRQAPGFQPQAGASKLSPLGPRPFEVTFPGQELVAAPTNPFVQRSANSWATPPATKPSLQPSQHESETSHADVELNWQPQFSLYAEGELTPPPPRQWNLQAKLTIGQPNDPYEQEADQVAAQVMAMPAPTPQVQRQSKVETLKKVQPKPLMETITPIVQRQEASEDEAPIQAKCEVCEQEEQVQRTGNGVEQAQPDLESRLNASKGGGNPLSDEVRIFMEPRFGADFSQVRVHTGSEAVQMSRELNAQAFTHKQDVYFGAGKAPGKDALTAHELTHVVQQTGGIHFSNVRVHTGSDAVQQAGGTDRLVQRAGAEQDESSAPTEGGAEESGLSDIACELLPDSVVVALVRAYFAVRYPLASRHLTHYLNGSGAAFEEDVRGLFAANPRALTRVAEQVRAQGGNSGSLVGRTSETAVVRQRDYDSEDWRLSLGNVDQIDFEIGEEQADGRTAVTLSLHDPYQWHPDEDRGDKCLHQTMERQKAKGAKDYMSEGSGVVIMRL